MSDGHQPTSTYPRWVASLAGWICRVFFRQVVIVGAELVPRQGPVLFVANHGNGLVDPLLVMGFLPGRPRFLAKSTLWNNPVLRPFLRLGGVIPVYRRRDPGFDAAKNASMFEACRRVLAAGGAIALFPEGQSHSEPSLTEIKTGAARILEVDDPAIRRTRIVPVGLYFDVKSRFRSRTLVRVGVPLELTAQPAGEASEEARRAAVRRLTDRIAEALRTVTLNYESWEDAQLVARAAEIYLREGSDLPRSTPLADRVETIARVQSVQQRLLEREPSSLQPLRETLAQYDALLRSLGLRDEQVAANYPVPAVTGHLARQGLFLLFWLPLAAAGMALNVLPFVACGILAARFAREPDQPATYKLFGGVVLYPLNWLALGVAAGFWLGGTAALAVLGLAVVSGWVTMHFLDRATTLAKEVRAFFTLRLGRSAENGTDEASLWRALRRQRAALRAEFLALSAAIADSAET